MTRTIVTKDALWFGALAPPVLALLLSPDMTSWEDDAYLWKVGRKLLAITLYTNGLMFAQAFAFNQGLARLKLGKLPQPVRLALYVATSVVVVTTCTLGVAPVLRVLAGGMVKRPSYLIVQGVIISLLWLGGILAWKRLLSRIHAERAKAHADQLAALDARVRLLQVRTNPHFLYNSLNTVMSLIATNPELAEETLGKLAGLFRYSLELSTRHTVSLEEELRVVEDYLSVEKVRFGERLRYSIDAPPALHGIRVPPMLLQPLVENAVKHGTSGTVAGGSVTVRAALHDGELVLLVLDDGPGPNGSTHRGTGTSVLDLKERLGLLYGNSQRLRTGEGAGGGYRAELRLPVAEVAEC